MHVPVSIAHDNSTMCCVRTALLPKILGTFCFFWLKPNSPNTKTLKPSSSKSQTAKTLSPCTALLMPLWKTLEPKTPKTLSPKPHNPYRNRCLWYSETPKILKTEGPKILNPKNHTQKKQRKPQTPKTEHPTRSALKTRNTIKLPQTPWKHS